MATAVAKVVRPRPIVIMWRCTVGHTARCKVWRGRVKPRTLLLQSSGKENVVVKKNSNKIVHDEVDGTRLPRSRFS